MWEGRGLAGGPWIFGGDGASVSDIEWMYDELLPFTDVNEMVKTQHIEKLVKQ